MSGEAQVGFLFKAASCLGKSRENPSQSILKSYYLMRCRELAKDHGLPEKYFSAKFRCPRCFTEWKRGTETKVRSIKLSKRQRKRIKSYKITNSNKEYVKSRKELLSSNELEQKCSFCKNTTTTLLQKPSNIKLNEISQKPTTESVNDKLNNDVKKVTTKVTNKVPTNKTVEVNVYSKAKDVFSLTNKDNTLASTVKEHKVIKNNKKKKDKFAGLCQQAVMASAKLKQDKDTNTKSTKQNKLNLFLKPSS